MSQERSPMGIVLLESKTGKALVKEKCQQRGIDPSLLGELLGVELEQLGRLRRRGINDQIDELLSTYSND